MYDDFSDIYEDLYGKITKTKTFKDFVEGLLEQISQIITLDPKISTDWQDQPVVIPRYELFGVANNFYSISINDLEKEIRSKDLTFSVNWEQDLGGSAVRLFNACVNNHDIIVHGLVRMTTVNHGTSQRKNRFAAYIARVLDRGSKARELDQALNEAKHKVLKETLQIITSDKRFTEKIFRVQMDAVIKSLHPHKDLPDSILTQAFNEFLVQKTIEE